jgi:cytochrome c oxidase subunit 2
MTFHRLASAVALVSMISASCAGDLSQDAERGRLIAATAGCAACHGHTGEGLAGPPWQGMYNATVQLEDGSVVTADDAYLARAIRDPGAQVAAGYRLSMPANVLTEAEIAAVVAYIKELS